MASKNNHTADAGGNSPAKDKAAPRETTFIDEDACRCKDVAKMSASDLAKLMVRDLAFWKKEKGS